MVFLLVINNDDFGCIFILIERLQNTQIEVR